MSQQVVNKESNDVKSSDLGPQQKPQMKPDPPTGLVFIKGIDAQPQEKEGDHPIEEATKEDGVVSICREGKLKNPQPVIDSGTMEYLSQNLNRLQSNPGFQFHPRYAWLNITYLCFADDLLLFPREDLESVTAIHSCFEHFSAASRLQANLEKISLYFGGVAQRTQDLILQILGFLLGRLWIRWIHSYYIKNQALDTLIIPAQACWMTKKIIGANTISENLCQLIQETKKIIRQIYLQLIDHAPRVRWKCLMFDNQTRPKARFTIWLHFQNKLLTMDKLAKWSVKREIRESLRRSTEIGRRAKEQQAQSSSQEANNASWHSQYSPSVISTPSSSRPATPSSSSSSSFNAQSPTNRPSSVSHDSPAETAGIIAALRNKRCEESPSVLLSLLGFERETSGLQPTSLTTRHNHNISFISEIDPRGSIHNQSVNELKKLVTGKDVYHNFLISLEAIKTQDSVHCSMLISMIASYSCCFPHIDQVRDELRNETLLLARENLEKEPWIMELRNQCRIICTTELAAAQEKMHELERRKEELLELYSPVSLLHQLQDAMKKTEEESEALLGQLLDREIDLTTFVQKSKKLGCSYHKRALTHLAAKAYLAA
ncbi:Vacuolar protein-sorting-associated protein 37 -like protein 1 [Capsicum annuum]|nr:Vacuolar protein-sorting-associated protein 37 -like protein 1 [Capsicum annuum]